MSHVDKLEVWIEWPEVERGRGAGTIIYQGTRDHWHGCCLLTCQISGPGSCYCELFPEQLLELQRQQEAWQRWRQQQPRPPQRQRWVRQFVRRRAYSFVAAPAGRLGSGHWKDRTTLDTRSQYDISTSSGYIAINGVSIGR